MGSAQIQIRGTTLGTLSRPEGGFTIAGAPAGALTLVVRRIGYKQAEHAVGASDNDVQIALEHDVLHLEQTVITGQATVVKKENVANDVAVCQRGSARPGAGADDRLTSKGRSRAPTFKSNSGAPGGGMQIQLRGASSLIGTSDPLYVVDGVVVSDSRHRAGTEHHHAGVGAHRSRPTRTTGPTGSPIWTPMTSRASRSSRARRRPRSTGRRRRTASS